MKNIVKQRNDILSLLYDARYKETRVRLGFVTIRDIKDAVGDSEFNIGVLVGLKHIRRDGNKVRITAKGVIAYETSQTEL